MSSSKNVDLMILDAGSRTFVTGLERGCASDRRACGSASL